MNTPRTMHNAQSTDLPGDVVLSVRGVSKKFCRNLRRSMLYGMQDLARNLLGVTPSRDHRQETIDLRPQAEEAGEGGSVLPQAKGHGLKSNVSIGSGLPPLRKDEFWALQDITFQLRRGECVGLIGQNGSGKSTLLRSLAGIFPPNYGEIAVQGRVGALIALGAGFHPHMTGRENIFLNGAILGLTQKEIQVQLDEIIDFADIGEFVDAPVATYSSGMTVRLGFAIATTLAPDLLLIDEVLAVGDAAFRGKCYRKIGALLSNAAVVLVSHDMTYINQFCTRVIYIRKGVVEYDGEAKTAVEKYLADGRTGIPQSSGIEQVESPVNEYSIKMTQRPVSLGQKLDVVLTVEAVSSATNCLLRIVISENTEIAVAEWNSSIVGQKIDLATGLNVFPIDLGSCRFRSGKYCVDIYLYDSTRLRPLVYVRDRYPLTVVGSGKVSSSILLPT